MSRRPALRPAPQGGLRELFGLDLRSLALFRIALAGLLLVDLAARFETLDVTATDRGVLPVRLVLDPSLHTLSGSYGFQLALLGAAALFALLLLVGLATRTVTLASWLLLLSFLYRNPYLSDGGDVFASKLLLWSLFLPLGARASLDARRQAREARAQRPTHQTSRAAAGSLVVSAATLGLLAEFVYLYVSAGLVKASPEWRSTFTALEQVMSQSYWLNPAGELLRPHTTLLRVLTPVVPLFEVMAPLLLFLPFRNGPLRCALILAFWAFQLGLGLCVQLNLFPWFSSVATLALVPGWLWDRGGVGARATASPPVPAWANAGAGLALLGLALGAAPITRERLPDPVAAVLRWAAISHRWTMYAKAPVQDFRFELRGTLADGSSASLLDAPGAAGWARVRSAHEGYRLRYFLQKATRRAALLEAYLAWLCREWNQGSDPARRLVAASVFVDVWKILPRSEPERQRLATSTCP